MAARESKTIGGTANVQKEHVILLLRLFVITWWPGRETRRALACTVVWSGSFKSNLLQTKQLRAYRLSLDNEDHGCIVLQADKFFSYS